MEDAVYLINWSQSEDGWALWVKSRPQIRGRGATYSQAERSLLDAICAGGGAMHAVFEFDPRLPPSTAAKQYATPDLCIIGGGDRFETSAPRWRCSESPTETDERLRWTDQFYDAPLCRACKCSVGRRNREPLVIERVPAACDAAFGSTATDGGPIHQLVSDEFLTLLTDVEKRNLEFRPTVCRGRRAFYELVGPDGPPLVAAAGLKLNGWRCAVCGHRNWGHWSDGLEIHTFIARCDLPTGVTGVFTIGASPEVQLAVVGRRWQEMLGRKGTRGFVSSRLGVVSDGELVRDPELPVRGT